MKFVSVFFLFVISSLYAQALHLDWANGIIVLKNREVLIGEVVLQPSFDIVLFRSENVSTYIPIDEINYLNYRDKTSQLVRRFVSKPMVENGRVTAHMLESVVSGKLGVLRKPKGSSIPAVDDAYGFDYFILQDALLIEFSSFKSKVYPSLNTIESAWVEDYVHQNNLDLHHPGDIIQLADYYNRYHRLLPWSGMLVKGS